MALEGFDEVAGKLDQPLAILGSTRHGEPGEGSEHLEASLDPNRRRSFQPTGIGLGAIGPGCQDAVLFVGGKKTGRGSLGDQRHHVIGVRSHQNVLDIDDPDLAVGLDQEIVEVIVAVTHPQGMTPNLVGQLVKATRQQR